ncbi:MAG: urocanate hydratase [Bdellovibrionia bacterium]
MDDFQKSILAGIPDNLPSPRPYDPETNHAPKRKDILTPTEKILAVQNALRYFKPEHHPVLAEEFSKELATHGRIYMYRFRPHYKMHARPLEAYPHRSKQAAAIMLMLTNNLDPQVAQHPHELITYGGNGAVFQNWAQYLLTMKYLATMEDDQTLVLYSGHPMGLFPSSLEAPRVVITNGIMIPNYSKPDDLERFSALGVTQYGQMTAGSFMYIGPQGIVHGTTITILNAGRLTESRLGGRSPGSHSSKSKSVKNDSKTEGKSGLAGRLFVSSGLGGMSGAQGRAAVIAGAIGVIAEVNPKALKTRHSQGWVDEVYTDLTQLLTRIQKAKLAKEAVALAYEGNVVELWERLAKENIHVDLGSDQTSLHNPWSGGYYPIGMSLEDANQMMASDPAQFKLEVQKTLIRHVEAIDALTSKGMYFFDYGNAFLLEASRAGADVLKSDGSFKYPSYVQDILGPMCFDFGFGPFRWVCASGNDKDLAVTDQIAATVLEQLLKEAPIEIKQQLEDNIQWIKAADKNKLVVGSQARILYADAEGRVKIALAFNNAIREGRISGLVVLGRDHHDVSGTDSPYRETSNIYDGSKFTADMAVHTFVGNSFRGATWVSLHNGGGVGWGEVMNGGFGMVLDGTSESDLRVSSMLFWDVNNGIARRSWARNKEAVFAIKRAMKTEPKLIVTLPNLVNEEVERLIEKITGR